MRCLGCDGARRAARTPFVLFELDSAGRLKPALRTYR